MVKSGVIMGGLYNTSVDVWQRHMLRNLWQLTILVWNVVQTWYPRWLVSMFEAFWRSFWKDHPTEARKLGVILARLVIINWQISIGSLSSFNKHTNTTSQPTAFLRLLPNLSHIYVYIYIYYIIGPWSHRIPPQPWFPPFNLDPDLCIRCIHSSRNVVLHQTSAAGDFFQQKKCVSKATLWGIWTKKQKHKQHFLLGIQVKCDVKCFCRILFICTVNVRWPKLEDDGFCSKEF